MLKRLMMAIALWGFGTPAVGAECPVEGNMGVLYKPLGSTLAGLEAEVGPRGGPWHVGGLYQIEIHETHSGLAWEVPQIIATWGRYDWELPNGDAFGPIAGLSYSPTTQYIGQPTPDVLSATGVVLGGTYTLRSGPLWVRAMPHVVLGAPRPNGHWFSRSGLPWIEFGWMIVPGLQASARFTDAFFKLACVF
jgi:hypothetical protein